MCLVAHIRNLYDFPLLQAELVKSRVELGLEIFCIDSYICIKDIFINSMNNPMVEESKPADRENLEENTV